LDETLIHSELIINDFYDFKSEVHFFLFYLVFQVITPERRGEVYVSVRPGAEKFIKEMSKNYEIFIFTASTKEVILIP